MTEVEKEYLAASKKKKEKMKAAKLVPEDYGNV